MRKKERHGYAKTKTYRVWVAMNQRCHNQKSSAYKNYGGRGITVCPEWRASFLAFLADMGPAPTDDHEIDRTENSQGYSKENCRWTDSRGEQMRNTRRNRWLTHDGRTMVMEDWAKELGIASHTLLWRVRNWPLEQALSRVGPTARDAPHRGHRMLTHEGVTRSISDWARCLKVSLTLLRQRIKAWGQDRALSTAGLVAPQFAPRSR